MFWFYTFVLKIFRNNFLRLWIVKVCQQSEKHFDKIINVDEFIRRVFSVIHSNDPVSQCILMVLLFTEFKLI